jgi:transforming growth factor-beta-induced protein
MRKWCTVALCVLLSVSAASCGGKEGASRKDAGASSPGNIVEVASGDGHLTTFVTAVNAAGLAEMLAGKGPFTVFAPIDSAFAKLLPGTIESLYQEPETLRRILLMHVVPGRLSAAELGGMQVLGTASGAAVRVTLAPQGAVMVGGARIVIPDIPAANGVIHVIDRVLLPPAEP